MIATLQRVFTEGFRVFFLAAGLYAIFAVLVWVYWFSVQATGGVIDPLPFAVAPPLWHAHEMIFGYASVAIAGFLLTAAPNWTGAKSGSRWFITLAACLWLAGRLAIWFSASLPGVWVAVIDLAFLPLLAIKLALMLLKRPKPQNMVFLGFLTVIWLSNLMVHLEWTGLTENSLDAGMRAGLFTLCALIAVLGGRVTPAFTRNAMKRAGVDETRWPRSPKPIERPAILLTALIPLAVLANAAPALLGPLALAAGTLQLIRLGFWRGAWTIHQPILWSLHLAIGMLGLGLILWGLSQLGITDEIAALHVLGIGCVGGMTLAVMSRAILGHSGRALVAPRTVAWAYGFIAFAAALRWFGSELMGAYNVPLVLGSGVLWLTAFTLFIGALWTPLTKSRPTP